jgi:G3E family GTPase
MNKTNSDRLPVILLTGFLGSGKTTLLLRWLQESPVTGRRLGIVMNEFGEVSVDSLIVSKPNLALEQVSGGCVCCAPDNELPRALVRMIEADACDFAVVETSGLADPDATIDMLTDYELLPRVDLQAVLTVVDACWYARPGDEVGDRVLANKQIRFANWILLSKCDRITEAEIESVQAQMRVLNPAARVVRLPFALPDLAEILGTRPGLIRLEPETPAAHAHETYQSISCRLPVALDRRAFENFLRELPPREVTRAKGFVRFRQEPQKIYLFQAVMGYHILDEFKAEVRPDPVAVLIGPRLDGAKYTAQLRELLLGPERRRLSLLG